MRPLTEEETTKFFEKLSKFIGRNIKHLLEKEDGKWCFRLHQSRVYFVRIDIAKIAESIPRKELICLGTCMGKFTKSGAFHLKVTALHILAQYSTFKIWLKPSGEMTYLYGNHVSKLHLARITSNTPKHQGVVVFSSSDIPLGFAVTAFSTQECRNVDASAIIAYNQSDTGEYLRDETKVI